ncbi:MAG: DUF6090 family protein [Xanthomonadales bacterium]|nr:DUF6090 family protein [Xanthomonadales bacterium]
MVLRRLAEAIRTQNWFTVLIELVIVVVGIVLGIEVANWNEERLERREEQAYLERLHADLESAIVDVTQGRDGIRSWRTRAHETLFALIENDPEAAADDTGFELQASTRIALAEPQMATLHELISAGNLGIISNPDLRVALSRLDARIKNLDGHNLILVPFAAENAVIIQSRLVPVEEVDTRTGGWHHRIGYDFDELAADREFQNALGFALRLQRANDSWLTQMVEELVRVRDLLEAELAVR